MKKLIGEILLVLVFFVLTNVAVRAIWIQYVPKHCDNHIGNPNVTTLVIGSSMSACSINDSILNNCINLSGDALWFCANYNSLRWLCEYTDQKIDTVICCAGLPSFLTFTKYDKDKCKASWLHQTEKYSVIDYPAFIKDFIFQKGVIETLCQPLNRSDFNIERIGGSYLYLNRNKIHTQEALQQITNLTTIWGYDGFTECELRNESKNQVLYLRKISDYCKKHNIVFIIYNAPCYNINCYISDQGYRDFLYNEFGPNQLIADYSQFKFPDDSYYSDYFHLNYKGANYLSNFIKMNNWHLVTASYFHCENK